MSMWYPVTFDIRIIVGLLTVAAIAVVTLVYVEKKEHVKNKRR